MTKLIINTTNFPLTTDTTTHPPTSPITHTKTSENITTTTQQTTDKTTNNTTNNPTKTIILLQTLTMCQKAQKKLKNNNKHNTNY